MGYSLGIDLGTTTCTVARRQGSSVEVSPVGEAGAALPAVALPTADGRVLVGDEADAHSIYEPPLVARHLLGRLGDGAPIDVDGHPVDALGLTAALLGAAADRAAPAPGAAPDHVVVTFPLEPGTGPEDLMSRAADVAFGATTTLVPAPIAAVARTAAVHDLGDDALVAVVDLGGATVDVALVRRTPTAFDLIGDPAVLPDLGGVDLDGAVLSLVEGAIGDVSSMVDPADGAAMLSLRRLRASCRAAKERLSTHTTAIVEVAVPHARGRVEITREAFERTIEPALGEATDLVESTIDAAGLTPPDLRAVVLTGGTGRIPLVTRLLTDRLGLPVLREDAPETTAALGAAMFADVHDAVGAAG
ncbi:MAG TPA: Hsp70 family protein, partial [Acidimicrobiales bacterium]|nr:Hsp70 family protein [Acidimicrobiales bacterium]